MKQSDYVLLREHDVSVFESLKIIEAKLIFYALGILKRSILKET